jgi:hypothetical protein
MASNRAEPPMELGHPVRQLEGLQGDPRPGSRPQQFSTGMIEVGSAPIAAKSTLLERARPAAVPGS